MENYKINQPITAVKVIKKEDQEVYQTVPEWVHGGFSTDEPIQGFTYKIKQPNSTSALYVTIGHTEFPDGVVRPYQLFLYSKDMSHYQWTTALTRTISAVFRKGGEVDFLIDELKSICAPDGGGYWKKGVFVPSLVAEIGIVLETHLNSLKSKEKVDSSVISPVSVGEEYTSSATLCPKCNHRALVRVEGCETCLNCSHSKCG